MSGGSSLALAPLLPWPLLAAVGLAAAGLVGWALFRRVRGAWWRLAGLIVVALALVNPSLVSERREPLKDVAVVVVDESPSQHLGVRTERTRRALADLEARLPALPGLELRVVRAGAGAVSETRLFEALDRTLADVPRAQRAGVILLTDGQVHDIPAGIQAGAQAGRGYGPVHVLLSGDHDEADRRLEIVEAPQFGLVGKPVSLRFRVIDQPAPQTATAVVTVREDNGGLRRLTVPVGTVVPLEITPGHAGQTVVELAVEPAPRELTLANNRAAVMINAVRDRLRVLLVSGEPYAGERTWRNMLKADPAVDLVHFTILRPPEKQDGTPIRELSLIAFPIRELFELKLREFDLIIFDRYRQRGVLPLLYLDNIARYVRAGGALLEVGGATLGDPMGLRGTALGEVLPGEPSGSLIDRPFTPQVTALGRRHPVTAGLPGDAADGPPAWGRWLHQAALVARRGAVVMTGAEGRPLLILDRVGSGDTGGGRVAQLASDQIWLWSRGYEGGGPQAELLRRLAHWLMKEPELEEDVLRARVEGNRIIVERQSLQPDNHTVEMLTPAETTETLTLTADGGGLARTVVAAADPGLYRFSDGRQHAVAAVGGLSLPELAEMRTSAAPLAGIVRDSGGGILWLADLEHQPGGLGLRRPRPDRDQAGPGWLGLSANGGFVVAGVSETSLLPAWLLLLAALAALFGAWRCEGGRE